MAKRKYTVRRYAQLQCVKPDKTLATQTAPEDFEQPYYYGWDSRSNSRKIDYLIIITAAIISVLTIGVTWWFNK